MHFNHLQLLVPEKIEGVSESGAMLVARIEGIPYQDEESLMKFKTETKQYQNHVSNLLVKEPGTGSLCQLDK